MITIQREFSQATNLTDTVSSHTRPSVVTVSRTSNDVDIDHLDSVEKGRHCGTQRSNGEVKLLWTVSNVEEFLCGFELHLPVAARLRNIAKQLYL